MAGRKSIDRERLEPALMEAALSIIKHRGMHALTAREIAKSTGCSVGTVYNVFGSMDGLILKAGEGALGRLFERLESALAAVVHQQPLERMQTLARGYVAFSHDEPDLWQVLFSPPGLPSQERSPEFLQAIDRLRQLTANVAAPLFAHLDDEQASNCAIETAHLLWAAVHGIAALGANGSLGIVAKSTAEEMTRRLVVDVMSGAERRHVNSSE